MRGLTVTLAIALSVPLIAGTGDETAEAATPVAISLVKDIGPGSASGHPGGLATVGDQVYFRAWDGSPGLWRTDGTAAGTTLVKRGVDYVTTTGMANIGSRIFFPGSQDGHGVELWTSDGTEAGTTMVADIAPGADDSWPGHIVVLGSKVYFVARDAAHGYELWSSDGTQVGTKLVKDIDPGAGNGAAHFPPVVMGSRLYFVADDGTTGPELWSTDGTEAGTTMVKELSPGSDREPPMSLTVAGSTLYFIQPRPNDWSLWRSDGTADGTVNIRTFPAGGAETPVEGLTALGGSVLFRATDEAHGPELWRSDGTPAGTTIVHDILPGSSGSVPRTVTIMGELGYFAANGGPGANGLWKTDGTAGGTTLVKDGKAGSNHKIAIDGTLFMRVPIDGAEDEVWTSDGTAAGTGPLGLTTGGPGWVSRLPTGGAVVVGAPPGTDDTELWKASTSAPTAEVQGLSGSDRIASSIAIACDSYAATTCQPLPGSTDSASAVILARADGFADALAGTPLAARRNAPLLLTGGGSLDPRVESFLSGFLPPESPVYLLGGEAALGAPVADRVRALGYEPIRIAGANRFATAVAIANEGADPSQPIILATGDDFPDALVGGAAAAAVHGTVLLTDGARLPGETATYLAAHPGSSIFALGGPAAGAAPHATAIIGRDRFETARLVAERFYTSPRAVGLASGETFADALSGGGHIARREGPLLLTAQGFLPEATTGYLSSARGTIVEATIYGGASVIGPEPRQAVVAALSAR